MSETSNNLNKIIFITRYDISNVTPNLLIKQSIIGTSSLMTTQAGIGIDISRCHINNYDNIDIGIGDLDTIEELYENKEFKLLAGMCNLIKCNSDETIGLIINFVGNETKYEELIDTITEYDIEILG